MRTVVVLALALVAAGCTKDPMEVVSDPTGADDYGHADLLTAVAAVEQAPTSPIAFRALQVRVDELRPRFNRKVSDHAELELAFLALGPMRAVLADPPEAQMAQLATTVWPTALRVEPEPGEAPAAYLTRVCSTALAGECKYVVPEAWPVVIGAKVWRRMKVRARDAYGGCQLCAQDPSFAAVLEDYDRHDTTWQARAASLGDSDEPSFWPRAGAHARPWSASPLLELGHDEVRFEGETLGDDEWRRLLRERRADREVLAVHLRPRQEIRTLRAAIADAGKAGWREIALVARASEYPWERREYRIAIGGRGRRLEVRDVDSIQVLVQALEVFTPSGPVRL